MNKGKMEGERKYAVVLRQTGMATHTDFPLTLMSDDTGTPFVFDTPEEARANVYEHEPWFVGIVLIGRWIQPEV